MPDHDTPGYNDQRSDEQRSDKQRRDKQRRDKQRSDKQRSDNRVDWLTDGFAENRAHLGAVAYRMLGSRSEADDAVQEAWLRLRRADSADVRNLGGWLTTVVARVCLDMLRSRTARREQPLGVHLPEPLLGPVAGGGDPDRDPEQQAVLGDSVGVALLVVLDSLAPAERLAFVLHDMFGVPFEEIAPIVGRSTVAARQLASRARRRVRGAPVTSDADLVRQRKVVEAFLRASREGDFAALLAVLDPDVVLRADSVTVRAAEAGAAEGAPLLAPEVCGAAAVADRFLGRAVAVRPALVNGAVGAVWAPDGEVRAVFVLTVAAGRVSEISLIGDPDTIAQLDLAGLPW